MGIRCISVFISLFKNKSYDIMVKRIKNVELGIEPSTNFRVFKSSVL